MTAEWLQLLTGTPLLAAVAATLLGLVAGSFLNVVIHRLPMMLERAWRRQCRELEADQPLPAEERFNLAYPPSRCPHCDHPIRAHENIPLFSFLWQRGRCRHCGARISVRYPVVELLTALLSAAVVWKFGVTWQAGAALLLTWALIALAFIDLDTFLLPDNITLPLLWLGLFLSLFGLFTDMRAALLGAMAGYLSLWSVYHLFRLLTGKEGLGYGDFKLLALLGAWLGWHYLPAIILLSSLVGAAVGITLIALRRHSRQVPIPFGPYLAAAGWLALMWGETINHAYLRWAGLA